MREARVDAAIRVSAEPCDTEAAWRPWNLCVTVDQPGRYQYNRRDLTTPGAAIVWETFAERCRLRALATPDHLVLVVPLQAGPRARYWGRPVGPDRLPAMRTGGIDWILDRGHSHAIVLLAPAVVGRHADRDLQVAFEAAASAQSVPVKPSAVAPLGAGLLGLIEAPTRGREASSPTAVTALERELLRQLVEAIDMPRFLSTKPKTRSRRMAIERALEYLRVASLPTVKPSELAEVAGVSQRTLEYGFREMFDLTPLGFLHLLRLHALRRELMASEGNARPIRAIAERWGFYQHGRLSGYYRAAFGELPSETRARHGQSASSQALSRAQLQEALPGERADTQRRQPRQRRSAASE
jgi:AraC family ethanolamine operon transcriptional activator